MFETLTGSDGQEYLRAVSKYEWDDGGQAFARRLGWISGGATSLEQAVAERAGESAHSISTFLASNKDGLKRLSTGWFGLQHRSVGQVNPELVSGYASALAPYQGALVGDFSGVRGFKGLADSPGGELAAARDIFTVIGTGTDAAKAFRDAANDRIRGYLQTYGRAVAASQSEGLVALRYAAQLAGVADGAERNSGNTVSGSKSSQYWIVWAAYELASAQGVQPGDPDIPARFFGPDDRLRSPADLPADDLDAFATAGENYAFHHGAPNLGNDFDDWYEDAAGE